MIEPMPTKRGPAITTVTAGQHPVGSAQRREEQGERDREQDGWRCPMTAPSIAVEDDRTGRL